MKKKARFQHFFRSFVVSLIIIIILSILCIKQYQNEQKRLKNYYKTTHIYDTYGRFSNKIPGIMVLCYHRIAPHNFLTKFAQSRSLDSQLHAFNVNSDVFEKQMKYFHDNHVNIISIDEMMKLLNSDQPITKKYIVLTFDDADHTILDNAIPVMEKYNFPYTLFIATGKTHQYVDGSYMLSWKNINDINRSDLCTIGIHTNNAHYQVNGKPRLLQMTMGEFKTDYHDALSALKTHLNKMPQNLYFASPYGAITDSELNYLIQDTRVKAVFSLDNDINDHKKDNQEYGRLIVTPKNFKNIQNWLKPSE